MFKKVLGVAKMQHKVALHWCLLLCILTTFTHGTSGIPVKRSSFLDDDETIRTEVVDANNQTILDEFNLTRAQLSRAAAVNSAAIKESSGPPRDAQYYDGIKVHRIINIKHQLETVLQGATSEEDVDRPLHEMAAYPICNSESNESSWLHDNNVTIRFSDSLFSIRRDNLNLDSAVLRLYKINPNGTDEPNVVSIDENHKPKRCTTPILDSQIRVTVSIVHQRRNKRERKKRICNTIMVNVSQTGWVEIDIKRAIHIWENVERQQQQQHQQQQQQQQQQQHPHQQQQERQPHYYQQGRQPVLVGWLLIEVHDEEERPLKPGLFFKPPKCDQADLAIPWNYYGPHSSLPSFTLDSVPRSPRLDVKMIGYAAFAPKQLQGKSLHDQLRFNLRRQLYHLEQNSAELENESTTTFTPTADNLLDSRASTEMLHAHRKRQSHHHRHHRNSNSNQLQQQQPIADNDSSNNNSQEQQPLYLSTAENVEEQQQQQHTHRRRRRQHHNRHLHHLQQHQQQQQSEEMHQQLDDC